MHVIHHRRETGKSSYGLRKLLKITFDAWIIYSNKLLKISILISISQFIISIIIITYLLVSYATVGYKSGWASTISAILLSTSLLQLSIGILGLYIDRIFEQVRERPLYLIKERTDSEDV